MTSAGAARRLARVLPRAASIILPVDGALIDGPEGALGTPSHLFTPGVLEGIDSVLGYRGLLRAENERLRTTAFIANVSASTTLSTPTVKTLIQDAESVVRSGADAIAYQLHLSDPDERAMLGQVGSVVDSADRFGLPVLITAYPRRADGDSVEHYRDLKKSDPEAFTKLVCHVVRVAVELGADLVKTTYTGSAETFARVVDCALGIPIIVAGGPRTSIEDAVAVASDAVSAGARGIAFGRQVYLHSQPENVVKQLRTAIDQATADWPDPSIRSDVP